MALHLNAFRSPRWRPYSDGKPTDGASSNGNSKPSLAECGDTLLRSFSTFGHKGLPRAQRRHIAPSRRCPRRSTRIIDTLPRRDARRRRPRREDRRRHQAGRNGPSAKVVLASQAAALGRRGPAGERPTLPPSRRPALPSNTFTKKTKEADERHRPNHNIPIAARRFLSSLDGSMHLIISIRSRSAFWRTAPDPPSAIQTVSSDDGRHVAKWASHRRFGQEHAQRSHSMVRFSQLLMEFLGRLAQSP